MPKLKKTQNGGSYAIFYVPTFLSSKNQAWNLETRSASQLVKVGWELALSNHYSNWLLIRVSTPACAFSRDVGSEQADKSSFLNDQCGGGWRGGRGVSEEMTDNFVS